MELNQSTNALIVSLLIVLWFVLRNTKKFLVSKLAAGPVLLEQLQRVLNVDEPSEVLQKLQLESIASSGEIGIALKDEKLQKLIQDIDSSSDADNQLDKAMESEEFRIFTEKILSIIGT